VQRHDPAAHARHRRRRAGRRQMGRAGQGRQRLLARCGADRGESGRPDRAGPGGRGRRPSSRASTPMRVLARAYDGRG
jgi:hypothetical protein